MCVCVCVCVCAHACKFLNFKYCWYKVQKTLEKIFHCTLLLFHLQELVKLILQTHYDTVQYETTDNLLSETEFEALCSGHTAYRQHIEVALIRDGKLQIATRDNDKKVKYYTQSR